MHLKKRTNNKSSDLIPTSPKPLVPPLLNIIKLPTLSKVSSPQLTKKYFLKKNEPAKPNLTERKATKSLYNFSFSKMADEVAGKGKISELKGGYLIEENSLEIPHNSNCHYDIHTIKETYDEYLNNPSANLSKASSDEIRSRNHSAGKLETDRKSRKRTIKNEKAIESCNILNEELERLKSVLLIEQDRFKELEFKYLEATETINALKETLSSAEEKANEYEKIIKLNQSLRVQLDDLKNRLQSDQSNTQKTLSSLKEDLSLKLGEIEHLNTLLCKNDLVKKRYAESISNLEFDIKQLKKENSGLSLQLEKASNELAISSSRLAHEKVKNGELGSSSSQLNELNKENCLLKDKLSAADKKVFSLTSDLNEQKIAFFKAQSKWKAKKNDLRDLNSALKVQLKSGAPEVKTKDQLIRRLNTTKEDFNPKDLSEMQQKVIDLEMQVRDLKILIEKSQKMIDSKNAIISQMEERIKKKTGKEIIRCEKCFDVWEFVRGKCGHLLCLSCSVGTGKCSVCDTSKT